MDRSDAEAHWVVNRGAGWLQTYKDSVHDKNRIDLVAALSAYAPFGRVLDLGCNCGMLTTVYETLSPDVKVIGIDINHDAILDAKRTYPQHLWVAASIVDWALTAPVLQGEIDVIVSSSCLSHIRPADISDVLAALVMIGPRAMVFQEAAITPRHSEGQTECGVLEWRHDYVRLLAGLGWRRVKRTWQDITTGRPAAVQVFEPA